MLLHSNSITFIEIILAAMFSQLVTYNIVLNLRVEQDWLFAMCDGVSVSTVDELIGVIKHIPQLLLQYATKYHSSMFLLQLCAFFSLCNLCCDLMYMDGLLVFGLETTFLYKHYLKTQTYMYLVENSHRIFSENTTQVPPQYQLNQLGFKLFNLNNFSRGDFPVLIDTVNEARSHNEVLFSISHSQLQVGSIISHGSLSLLNHNNGTFI